MWFLQGNDDDRRREMAAQLLDTSNDVWRDCDAQELLAMIGHRNVLAISGGRVLRHPRGGVTLPVGHGYSVTIDLAANDTWTVRRIFKRGSKIFLHGEEAEVYSEELGQAAYRASCYVNVAFGE
jgi:hypothetical protein